MLVAVGIAVLSMAVPAAGNSYSIDDLVGSQCRTGCAKYGKGGVVTCDEDGQICQLSCDETNELSFASYQDQKVAYCHPPGNETIFIECGQINGCVSAVDKCPKKFEIYRDCGPCDTKCGEDADAACPTPCPQTCVCVQGYVRDFNGECVKECTVEPECGVNEVLTDCFNECEEPSCGDSAASNCTDTCTKGCTCAEGYFRKDDECVLKEDCCDPLQCPEPRPCDSDEISVSNPVQVVDGCPVGCNTPVCVSKYIEDGEPCGSSCPSLPSNVNAPNRQCRYPSTCLTSGYGGADAPAICGRRGAVIYGARFFRHLATHGVRMCNKACEEEDRCMAWQYRHRGRRHYGHCALVSSYYESYPYFSFWWYTHGYTSAIKY